MLPPQDRARTWTICSRPCGRICRSCSIRAATCTASRRSPAPPPVGRPAASWRKAGAASRCIAGADVIRPPPPYFEVLIAAYRAGHAGRDVHLGYWDRPPNLATPCVPGEFEAAQARLTKRMIGCAALLPGQRVLDVG